MGIVLAKRRRPSPVSKHGHSSSGVTGTIYYQLALQCIIVRRKVILLPEKDILVMNGHLTYDGTISSRRYAVLLTLAA